MTSHSLQSFGQTDAQALGSQTRSWVSRPTIILVHGSWQSPEVFTFLIPRLEKAGYSVFAPSLPSSGANPPLKNFDEDVKVIRSTVRSVLDTGKDVVIVMHSYGAIPGCEALKGLKDEGGPPAQGRYNSGKVLKLAFLAAMVVPVGQSTWKAERGESFPGFECKDGMVFVLDARTRFYNDLSESDAEYWVSRMRPQSRGAIGSNLTYAAYNDYPSSYLIATNDKALPLKVQERYASTARTTEISRVHAGHALFLSQPTVVERFIRSSSGESFPML